LVVDSSVLLSLVAFDALAPVFVCVFVCVFDFGFDFDFGFVGAAFAVALFTGFAAIVVAAAVFGAATGSPDAMTES